MEFLPGSTGAIVLDISLSNVVVQKGGYFELRLEHYLPNRIEDGFAGVFCGLKETQGGFTPLTRWAFFGSSPGMKLVNLLPEDYSGRLTVYNTTLQVNSAEFADEGRYFYCELIYRVPLVRSSYAESSKAEGNAR